MGKTEEYNRQREKELQEHNCAYRNQYTYISTRRDKLERHLEACDAGSNKMAQTICPFFQQGKPFEYPQPNGTCSAANDEVCQKKCRKAQWIVEDGKLVKV